MEIIKIIIGASLLTLGRKLYWLFIAAIGVVTGLSLLPLLFPNIDNNSVLIVSIILGIVGALLAIIIQKFALLIAGFLAGAFSAVFLAKLIPVQIDHLTWLIFLIGGIIGIILIGTIFDWALTLLSSVIGASLLTTEIVHYFQLSNVFSVLVFVVLMISGIILQSKISHK